MRCKALVLYLQYPSRSSYYDDWLQAFEETDFFEVNTLNILKRSTQRYLKNHLNDYDYIVLLHSCMADSMLYVEPIKEILSDARCHIASFVGNELNMPQAPLSQKIQFLNDIGAKVVFTQLTKEAGDFLYGNIGADVFSIPHALNPDVFKPLQLWPKRKIHVGVRSYPYPHYIGDNDRNRMIKCFNELCVRKNLVGDFSSTQRFDRAGWVHFLNSLKSTVATEAGTYFLEKDDATVIEIEKFCKKNSPKNESLHKDWFLKIVHRMPYKLKEKAKSLMAGTKISYPGKMEDDISFEEVYERFFKDRKVSKISGKCISSRHFDAVGTKTVQIMLEGRYNDILQPHEHYFPVKNDLSNAECVIDQLNDIQLCQQLVNRAYKYVLATHTYRDRLETISKILK